MQEMERRCSMLRMVIEYFGFTDIRKNPLISEKETPLVIIKRRFVLLMMAEYTKSKIKLVSNVSRNRYAQHNNYH